MIKILYYNSVVIMLFMLLTLHSQYIFSDNAHNITNMNHQDIYLKRSANNNTNDRYDNKNIFNNANSSDRSTKTPGEIFKIYQQKLESKSRIWRDRLYSVAVALFYFGLGISLLKDIIFYLIEENDIFKLWAMIVKQLTVGAMFSFWVYNPDCLINCTKYFINLAIDISNLNLDTSTIIDMGYNTFREILAQTYTQFNGLMLIPAMILSCVIALIIMLAFAIIALDYFMINVEFIIVGCIGIIVLGSAGCSLTRNIFLGYCKYFINAAIRALVLFFIFSASWEILQYYNHAYASINDKGIIDFINVLSGECIAVVIAMMLSKGVSGYVNAIISGNLTNSNNSMLYAGAISVAATSHAFVRGGVEFANDSLDTVSRLFNKPQQQEETLSNGASNSNSFIQRFVSNFEGNDNNKSNNAMNFVKPSDNKSTK